MNNTPKHLFSAALVVALAASADATDIKNLQAGTLANAGIDSTETALTISGRMNAADFSYILDNLNDLQSLDLTNVTIDAYSGEALPYTGLTSSPANTLPDYALTGLTRLKTIALPSSLQAIGKGALSGSGITSLTVPAGVETIGDYAAMRCESLSQITVDSKVKELGNRAFAYCPKLTTVNISATSASLPEGLFEACTSLSEVDLSSLVDCREIGEWAFAECNGLQTLMLPALTTEIESGALYGVNKVTTLTLPESVDYIGNNAMGAMSALQTLMVTDIPAVPQLGENVWASVDQNKVTLVTPDDLVDSYSEAPQWKNFSIMSETDFNDSTHIAGITVKAHSMKVTCSDNVIRISGGDGKLGKIAIFNAAGHRMVSAKANESITITVGGWPSGVYLVVSDLGAAKISL
ncbi:MAG: leucine-rich repeat domain-containing protein [Muribaculaceae bacterium]|nr:leucine-rich repeat domain-containing protein [Muribaculaceae bacterium]